MAYPKFQNKHREEALFLPSDHPGYLKLKNKVKLPKKYIILYDREFLDRIKRKYKLIKFKGSIFGCEFYWFMDLGIIKMRGIGSPHASTVLEEFIAFGGKQFVNIGTAGGLHKEGIFLCEKALRDEGTSYHYVSHGHFAHPDKQLTAKLGKSMQKSGIQFEKCTTWTIDAPYRETKAEIKHYKKQGISTVEMEASALFAVASVRKVKIASAFVVSDILGEKWTPKFAHINVKRGLDKLFEAAVACLSGFQKGG